MDPNELVKLIEILNPNNKPGRITIITRMGAENMRVKLPHLIRAVRRAGQIVTWVSDPMHGNTIKAPCGLKTRPFDSIRVICFINMHNFVVIVIIFFIRVVLKLEITSLSVLEDGVDSSSLMTSVLRSKTSYVYKIHRRNVT